MSAKPWDLQNATERARTLRAAKRKSAFEHPHPAWPLLRRIAAELGWPKAFDADLFIHDRTALMCAEVKAPFFWAIGETGTFLAPLVARRSNETEAKGLVRYLTSERPRMFYWDGVTLLSCTEQEAINVLCGRPWGWLYGDEVDA